MSNAISDACLNASGVNRDLLARVPTERAKYVGVGFVVYFTSFLAFCSATFAFHNGLRVNLFASLVAGALWGCGIFGIDRWLVASSARQGNMLLTLLFAVPRVAFALIIGAVVAVPLTLYAFNDAIATELVVMKAEADREFAQDLADNPDFASIPEREAELAQVNADLAAFPTESDVLEQPAVVAAVAELAEAKEKLKDASDQVVCEGRGGCGTGQAGAGPVFEQAKQNQRAAEAEVSRLQSALDASKQAALVALRVEGSATLAQRTSDYQQAVDKLDRDRAALSAAHDAHDRATSDAKGLLSQIEALERLEHKEPALRRAHLGLEWLLIAIEILPVLVKTLMSLGRPNAYERLVEVQAREIESGYRLERSEAHELRRLETARRLAGAELQHATDQHADEAGFALLKAHKADYAEARANLWRTEHVARHAPAQGDTTLLPPRDDHGWSWPGRTTSAPGAGTRHHPSARPAHGSGAEHAPRVPPQPVERVFVVPPPT